MLVLLAFIGFEGITQLKSVTNGYQNNVLREHKILEYAEEIYISILQVRRAEMDFVECKD